MIGGTDRFMFATVFCILLARMGGRALESIAQIWFEKLEANPSGWNWFPSAWNWFKMHNQALRVTEYTIYQFADGSWLERHETEGGADLLKWFDSSQSQSLGRGALDSLAQIWFEKLRKELKANQPVGKMHNQALYVTEYTVYRFTDGSRLEHRKTEGGADLLKWFDSSD